jgi:putative tryptophan/tyrosine transport system substrate-binding protein
MRGCSLWYLDRMTIRSARGLVAAIALAVLPLSAGAQPADKIWRIGYLWGGSNPTVSAQAQGFVQRVGELGYVEGQNLFIEFRGAAGRNEQLPELAADLVRANVALIVAQGTPAALAAKEATRRIPIVFSGSHPVEKGVVASLARPGGNITGIAIPIHEVKALEFLKQAAPEVSRVPYFYDPATLQDIFLTSDREQARALGIMLEPVALRGPDETDRVFAALSAEANGLLLDTSQPTFLARDRICALAAQRRLPSAGTDRDFVSAGCLLSYGVDFGWVGRHRADYVDRILKGAQPADLPVEQPTKFELVINLKTAKELGLTLPWMLVARADEVIE